jgi:hypothetical protein
MSYPYLLEHEGDVYCIPESADVPGLHLYKATAFPYRWVECATLIEGLVAVDPTVFRHGDRWWLLCAEREGDHNSRLHAWYAPDLFGPWAPHAANPIKTDVRSSRPGGTPFVHAGQLYRPAQDLSHTYGGAVTINRVLRLTPTDFEEEPVTQVQPYADSRYPDGLHTLSAFGPRTLIDGKRRYFIPHATQHVIRSTWRNRPARRGSATAKP